MSNTQTKAWEQWRKGKAYQTAMGFTDLFPKCVDFKEGRQWARVTESTKNLPRPVFNICDKIVSTKKANILNQQMKMVYSPSEMTGNQLEEEGAKKYTEFAEKLWKDIRQDDLNELCIDDSATLGTGILHYFWDTSVVGGHTFRYAGALRGESLDPLTVVFGNPIETDIQAQPYIIIASRVTVKSAKQYAERCGLSQELIDQICPDNENADTYEATRKNADTKYCTLLTKYYKDNGVHYDKCTRNVTIVEGENLAPNDEVFDYYPIALMPWKSRKRSIYGIGEIESIMDGQKAINWLNAMNLLSVQDTAWGKYIVKPNALHEKITNEPGQVIVDHSTTGDGIRILQGSGISSGAIGLADKFNSLIQYTSGVSEVVSGEPFTATMSASAIIALQNQAKVPIENIQRRYYRVIEQVGRIWEQFFKHYYDFIVPMKVEDEFGNEVPDLFLGVMYKDVDFDLDIDVGAGSTYSESLSQSTLDKLFDGGLIDLDTYIELCPKNVMPFKEELKRKVEQMRMQQVQPQGNPQMEEPQPQGRSPLGIELPPIPQAEGINYGL